MRHHTTHQPIPVTDAPVHDIRRFTWSREGWGSAELSDFNGARLDGQVWRGSCDRGFYVRGKRETKLFLLRSMERDDGDTLRMTYETVDGKHTVHVFND